METLVAVAQHRNQYCSRSRAHGVARFGSPSREFREISCRTFQAGEGILPTPLQACTPVNKRVFSPKSPSPSPSPSPPPPPPPRVVAKSQDNAKQLKKFQKTSAIPIPMTGKTDIERGACFNDEFSYSELWAGPAYSNSPPPSSLPIPKFFVRPKRTVSLDLPSTASEDLPFFYKSAPPSPTRDYNGPIKEVFNRIDSATKTLRRILNLDVADE